MNSTFVAVVFLFFSFDGFGQRVIDTAAYRNWPEVGEAKISDDGNYIIYETNVLYGMDRQSRKAVLVSSDLVWKMDLGEVGAGACHFTTDSRYAFAPGKDTLKIIDLRSHGVEAIPDIHSCKFPANDRSMWFTCGHGHSKELFARNMTTGDTVIFPHVIGFMFSPDGTHLALTHESKDSLDLLIWADLRNRHLDTIAQARGVNGLIFDTSGSKLAFSEGRSAIGYYDSRIATTRYITDTSFRRFGRDWRLNGTCAFSKDGERLFFTLERLSGGDSTEESNVTVWSYKDAKLVSEQLLEGKPKVTGCFAYNLDSSKLYEIGVPGNEVMLPSHRSERTDDIVLVRVPPGGDLAEMNWNKASRDSFYLVDTRTGEPIRKDGKTLYFAGTGLQLSLDGHFLLYYNARRKDYLALNLSTLTTVNIGKNIPEDGLPSVMGWITGDHSVLLYDRQNIWKVDLSGIKAPENITAGIGRPGLVFYAVTDYTEKVIRPGDTLLLSAFSRMNKDNGFYRVFLHGGVMPQLLTMGPWLYYSPEVTGPMPPVKAKNTSVYLVQRMTAEEAPNWYLSHDFKTFKRVSNNFPEKSFNWMKTELVQWRTFDGSASQGILYKPQNFDPKKKYPIIFYYYEKLSDLLHFYLKPGPSAGPMDIPTFVSRGYLVFTPDIQYKLGNPGSSAYNSVVSAAEFLAKRSYVDAGHMGIQGHSFGGYETDYIITHTHLFHAAVSASGVSDLIGAYLQIWDVTGYPGTGYYERSQGRMQYTLWQRPDLYLKNSPVMRADFVTTPLLLMNNKGDDAVPFRQGLEMLIALRRLGKEAWLLEYRDGEHTVSGASALDYNERLIEFFDHFLKGSPAPGWL